jgi:hypothetical protein
VPHITNSERTDIIIAFALVIILGLAAVTGIVTWFVWLLRLFD